MSKNVKRCQKSLPGTILLISALLIRNFGHVRQSSSLETVGVTVWDNYETNMRLWPSKAKFEPWNSGCYILRQFWDKLETLAISGQVSALKQWIYILRHIWDSGHVRPRSRLETVGVTFWDNCETNARLWQSQAKFQPWNSGCYILRQFWDKLETLAISGQVSALKQ